MAAGLAALALLGACTEPPKAAAGTGPVFPAPDRRVADIVSPAWDSESRRDEAGEAEQVMELLGIGEGLRVADIGAGRGYYAVRLARKVGPTGLVYAEDIVPEYLDSLRARLAGEQLANVIPVEGTTTDPKLPPGGIDVMLLSHMYHEIENPYEFLWRAQPAFASGGRLAIVDLDRETGRHGTPVELLKCELGRIGYQSLGVYPIAPGDGYLAVFTAPATRPEPSTIEPCPA